MFFNEDHLKITKVRTTDGISPVIGADERPMKKVIFAPLNPQSRKLFEDQNTRLPTNLKMKIEVVKGYSPEAIPASPAVDVSALEARIKELEQANKELTSNKISTESTNVSESTEKNKQHEKVK